MKTEMLEIEFLGTGTSTGVPQIRCQCEVCQSADPHDKRLRASAIVRYRGLKLLLDCGPDFRQQMLTTSDNNLDALLVTHIHYDHVGGIDDLRAYCQDGDFPIYARQDVIDDLHARLPYCFAEHPYMGVPRLAVTPIVEHVPFSIGDVEILPLPVMHYKLPILGFKIGPLAYITDCKTMDDTVVEELRHVPLLVINALRQREHLSHLSLSQTLALIERIEPGRAILIHMSHDMGLHAEVSKQLPDGVELAYDGMVVQVIE